MRKYPRLIGTLFFLVGVGLVAWFKYAYDHESSVKGSMLLVTPLFLIYGFAVMIQPRLLILKGEFHSAPPIYKILHIILLVVGSVLGFYLRFVIFKDWR